MMQIHFRASSFNYNIISEFVKKKKINKHCIVTSGHFIVSKSFFVLKVMANTWNIIFLNI